VPADISPSQFEELVLGWLESCASKENRKILASHLGVVEGAGGEYKIDVLIRFTVFDGAAVTMLVECKHQVRPVEREDVMVLDAKVRDCAAHKGMLFSTSGFQKGAIQYAATHGIATVTVVRGKWLYETRGADQRQVEPPPWAHFDTFAGIRLSLTDQGGILCHTIQRKRLDALLEWFSQATRVE